MLISTIRLYIENNYQGVLYEEMKLLLQKKIYSEMLLDGEMLIKDNEICLKTNSHVGNCNFYLFESGKCMLGKNVYDFINVDFVVHKDYNKFVKKLSNISHKQYINDFDDVNKLKLYMLSGSTLKIARLQYLLAINKNEHVNDNYKEFYENLKQINENNPLDYSRYSSETRFRYISKEIMKTVKDKYNNWKIKPNTSSFVADYFDFSYLSIERECMVRNSHYFEDHRWLVINLKNMWKFVFYELTLQQFVNLQSVDEVLRWLNITNPKTDKSHIRQQFIKQKLSPYLKYDLERYIMTHRQKSYTPVLHIPLENFLNQFQLIQEFFNNNALLKPLGNALNIL